MKKALIGTAYTVILACGSLAYAQTPANEDNAVPNMANPTAGAAANQTQPRARLSAKVNVLDKHVYNEKEEKIGDIRDILFDSNGNITHYVVGAGGFLGMAEHDVAISLTEFELKNNHFVLHNYTKEKLKSLTEVKLPSETIE